MRVNPVICQILLLLSVSIADADSENYVYTPSAVGYEVSFGSLPHLNSLGFDIRIFQYDFGNTAVGYEVDFMASGYTSNTLEYSLTGVGDINFADVVPDADANIPYEATLFGETFDVSNFVAEFTSYFYPTQSGFFKFESINTDDSMMFFLGQEGVYQGCMYASTFDFDTVNSSSYNMFTDTHSAGVQSYYQYLEDGFAYPIRIIYVNIASDYTMQLQITYPDGTVITDFDNNNFLSPNNLQGQGATCHLTTASTVFGSGATSWTGTTTSYSTYYPTGSEDVTVYYYYPDPTTTATAHYYGSTISSTVVAPTGAGTWTESIFYPEETVITSIPWTGVTTDSTTVIPDDPEIPATVVIEIPDAITTTTIPWTGAETSTTVIYPAEGKNGTVTVEVLTPRDVVISTTLWTGTFTSTYTTLSPENADGTVTVGVEIPRGTETVTDFWSGSTTSYTTEFPSDLNSEVTVHEYVPQSVVSGDIVYITTYWTGDFTSYSTANPGYSNGTTTVFVDIPQQVITETWSGVVTSTTFYCPYSGAASTPVVLVPSSTAVPESPENCESCESSGPSSTPSSESSSTPSNGSSEASGSGSSSTPSNGSSESSGSESSSSGSTEPSSVESFSSSSSTPDVDTSYSSSGNRLLSFNLISIISLLFIFSTV